MVVISLLFVFEGERKEEVKEGEKKSRRKGREIIGDGNEKKCLRKKMS